MTNIVVKKRYIDQEYGFTMDIPNGWEIYQNIDDMRLLVFREDEKERALSNLNLSVLENINNGTIEQILRKTRSDVRRMLQNFQAFEMKKIDNNLGSFICKGVFQGREYIYHQNIYIVEDEIFCFTSCFSCEDKEVLQAQLEYMLLSVEFC